MAIVFPYNAFLMSKMAMSVVNLDFLETDKLNYPLFGLRRSD